MPLRRSWRQDPAKRWLSRYEREAELTTNDTEAHIFGRFGVNENGLSDLAGKVWECSDTCFVRNVLEDAGPRRRRRITPMSPIHPRRRLHGRHPTFRLSPAAGVELLASRGPG